jgi:hypothetical protein
MVSLSLSLSLSLSSPKNLPPTTRRLLPLPFRAPFRQVVKNIYRDTGAGGRDEKAIKIEIERKEKGWRVKMRDKDER